MRKWQEWSESTNVLHRYKVRQFIEIIWQAEQLSEFDMALYFALVEKMTVLAGMLIEVTLLDGTTFECEID